MTHVPMQTDLTAVAEDDALADQIERVVLDPIGVDRTVEQVLRRWQVMVRSVPMPPVSPRERLKVEALVWRGRAAKFRPLHS